MIIHISVPLLCSSNGKNIDQENGETTTFTELRRKIDILQLHLILIYPIRLEIV